MYRRMALAICESVCMRESREVLMFKDGIECINMLSMSYFGTFGLNDVHMLSFTSIHLY